MYLSHFQLSTSPFGGRGPSKHLFPSSTHQEALARLEFLVKNRRTLGLLLGAGGTGKSVVLQELDRRLKRYGCRVAAASLAGTTSDELLWTLTAQLGCSERTSANSARLWARLGDRLAESRRLQQQTVFLLDDLDMAASELQSFLIRLVRADPAPDAFHTLILAFDDAGLETVSDRLLDLVDLRVDLDPWSVSETGEYLAAAMTAAGCRNAVFDDEAVAQIHDLSGGVPRQVNRLADLALIAAAGQRADGVDGETVAAVAGELVAF